MTPYQLGYYHIFRKLADAPSSPPPSPPQQPAPPPQKSTPTPPPPSPATKYMKTMSNTFQPKTAPPDMTVQFNITGANGGKWYADVKGGKLTTVEGMHPKPTATINTTDEVYNNVSAGKLSDLKAYLTGKIKVDGSILDVRKFNAAFKR